MTFESSLAFIAAMIVFAASPGPGNFAVIAQAISKGSRSAFALLTGITFGDLTYLLGAFYGLGYIASELELVFIFIKYAGALYLLWMAYQAFTSPVEGADLTQVKAKTGRTLITGFTISISNPKVIVFYLAFLPTFLDLKAATSTDIFLVMALTVLVIYGVIGFYIISAAKLRTKLNQPLARRWFNRISGGMLTAAGIAVVTRS